MIEPCSRYTQLQRRPPMPLPPPMSRDRRPPLLLISQPAADVRSRYIYIDDLSLSSFSSSSSTPPPPMLQPYLGAVLLNGPASSGTPFRPWANRLSGLHVSLIRSPRVHLRCRVYPRKTFSMIRPSPTPCINDYTPHARSLFIRLILGILVLRLLFRSARVGEILL